jgi:hypothetical protein
MSSSQALREVTSKYVERLKRLVGSDCETRKGLD